MQATQTSPQVKVAAIRSELFISFELSDKSWKVTVSDGHRGPSRYSVDAGDKDAVAHCIERARERGKLDVPPQVHSRYEAGRDSWWLHRWLTGQGIDNIVVDSASKDVNGAPGGRRRIVSIRQASDDDAASPISASESGQCCTS
ncbi:hypothetical protein QZH52_33955 [Variovorax ginsengisoli]|uniref:Transposase n=1 Tax=Variovorax ginsengisoli TaxID=363844 RepID=A0ABT8SEC6_9BURK|nr:hypothetical protein [Variovorax ginsengisoli]MDN8618109.1 hypothetical protein [Variovorax ginsengisoli]MDO1537279.1 hypothetical protein [Variovorax ginsengisoli]